MPHTILFTCSDANSLRNFRGRLIGSLRSQGYDVVAVAPSFPPAIAKWCEDLGVAMELTSLDNQSLNPFRDFAVFAQLFQIMKRRKPDVVMGYTHKPALYTAFAAKVAGVPRVTMMVTGIGFGFEPGAGLAHKIIPAITRTLFRLGCAAADTVIFHNKDNRDFFLSQKLLREPNKAVVVGGSGVDLSYFHPQPLERTAPDEATFLLIARIVRYKGIIEYARAAQALRARYPKAKFLLAGYHDANPLAYSDEEWRFIQEHLDYRGPSDDVRSLYRRAQVYVLPSYGEGMPRTVLEAMASGRAIVTTDTYGCRDTVEKGVNGHLVPTRAWKPLAAAMERFLSGESSYQEMGAASLARVRRLFDVEEVNREMFSALGLIPPTNAAVERTPAAAAQTASLGLKTVRIAGRALSLSSPDRRLAAQAAALLGAFNLAVKLLPFARAISLGSAQLRRPGHADGNVVRDCVLAVRRASYAVPWRSVCIHEGLALQRLLRRRGIDATLCYGTSQTDGDLKSHVWVKVGDELVIGGEEAARFHLVALYPPAD